MEEILKELEDVFQTISSIPVTHNSVDAMAVARGKLRKIYTELKNMAIDIDRKEGNGNGNGA